MRAAPDAQPRPGYVMPVQPEHYDCSPLSDQERHALTRLLEGGYQSNSKEAQAALHALERLRQPLHHVFALRNRGGDVSGRPVAVRILCREMHRRQRAFWQWSQQDWVATLSPSTAAFQARHGLPPAPTGLRPFALDVAYLLCGFEAFDAVWEASAFYPMACAVFGALVVDGQIARVDAVLSQQGYATGQQSLKLRHQAIVVLLLLNRSPWLDGFSLELIDRAQTVLSLRAVRIVNGRLRTALAVLGVLPPSADPSHQDLFTPGPADGMSATWYAWYLAWRATGSRGLARRVARHYGVHILYAGRWLARFHPDIVVPGQWTEAIALEFRTAVLDGTNDWFVSAQGAEELQRRGQLGRRLSHASIVQFLAAMRRFFRDLQTKAHTIDDTPACRIPRLFEPRDVLAVPQDIQKAVAGSEPRDIDLKVWQRLAIQAARLTPQDLGPMTYWPFAAVQAMALLWVSTARRPNELLRLRVDFVREHWEPAMCDDEGLPLPAGEAVVGAARGEQVSYLHIPSSKYAGPGWIWIPQYTADAIARWRAERGTDRAALYDHKDRAFADLLFTQRGQRMSLPFLNRRLIPMLCQKANVDPFDAEGAYTAHRGRSARISMLHACGLDLDDLAAYAIHKDTHTIKKYARRHPIHLHRKVAAADTLSTVIEGLFDPEAALRGEPATRWLLGYDADGTPQFCGLPAHHTCPHRLDCPHCGLFIGGTAARLIAEDPTMLKVTAEIPTTVPQQLLTQGQTEAAERALAALQHTTPPLPPSAAYLTNPAGLSEHQLKELARAATQDAYQQLRIVAEDLRASLALSAGKDSRNAVVRAERVRLALVEELLSQCRLRLEQRATTTETQNTA